MSSLPTRSSLCEENEGLQSSLCLKYKNTPFVWSKNPACLIPVFVLDCVSPHRLSQNFTAFGWPSSPSVCRRRRSARRRGASGWRSCRGCWRRWRWRAASSRARWSQTRPSCCISRQTGTEAVARSGGELSTVVVVEDAWELTVMAHVCLISGALSWRKRWPRWRKRSITLMTCWRVSRGKFATWLSRYQEHTHTEVLVEHSRNVQLTLGSDLLLVLVCHTLTCPVICTCVCSFRPKMQLQNSRTLIQERDRVIRDLEEKVAFLEAEVRHVPQRTNLTPNEWVHVVGSFHAGHLCWGPSPFSPFSLYRTGKCTTTWSTSWKVRIRHFCPITTSQRSFTGEQSFLGFFFPILLQKDLVKVSFSFFDQ